jgi:hypothetical protein
MDGTYKIYVRGTRTQAKEIQDQIFDEMNKYLSSLTEDFITREWRINRSAFFNDMLFASPTLNYVREGSLCHTPDDLYVIEYRSYALKEDYLKTQFLDDCIVGMNIVYHPNCDYVLINAYNKDKDGWILESSEFDMTEEPTPLAEFNESRLYKTK